MKKMRLDEAIKCIEEGKRVRHEDWYRSQYVERLDGILTLVWEWEGLGNDYIYINYEYLERQDDMEECWEIHTGKLIPDKETKDLYKAIDAVWTKNFGCEDNDYYDFLAKDSGEKDLVNELWEQMYRLSWDYDFGEDD